MRIFDSHCHMDDEAFETDFKDVLQRAASADVRRMLVVGVDQDTSARALALAKTHPHLYASVGVHPHEAQLCSEKALTRLGDLAADAKVVAWGEIGLDFNRMHSPREDQEKWLIRQLEIADELALPIVFHERDSQGRLLDILERMPHANRRAVVHCFSGSESELHRYLDMGFYVGITGIATIKKRGAELREMLPAIPANRILVETDAPYLTPTPQRNKFHRNEPAFVRAVLLKVAEVRGDDPQELAEQVWTNTCKLFSIDPE